jgi:hypothetical protein
VSGRPIEGGRASPCAAGGEGAVPQELEQMLKLGPCGGAKFPRNLPVPCRLSDVYGPRQTGMGAIVMERATAKMRALQRLSHRQARSSLAVVRELQLARRLNLEST